MRSRAPTRGAPTVLILILIFMNIDFLRDKKIGVLAGGTSSEREISLKSGKAVLNALCGDGLNAVFIDVREGETEFLAGVAQSGIDVAFIALHGRFGEDGTVQKLLESVNTPYTGSDAAASKVAYNKLFSRIKFKEKGLRVPDYIVTDAGKDYEEEDAFFPCVVKPACEGSSIGLSIVNSRVGFREALDRAALFGEKIIVEKFVAGREMTVGILGMQPLPVVEVRPAQGVYDFNAKYIANDTEYIVPAALSESELFRVQEAGVKAHAALGCGFFSRVDLILSTGGEVVILEVNTIPGFTERSLFPMAARAAGIGFSELCIRMLRDAFERHRVRQ